MIYIHHVNQMGGWGGGGVGGGVSVDIKHLCFAFASISKLYDFYLLFRNEHGLFKINYACSVKLDKKVFEHHADYRI